MRYLTFLLVGLLIFTAGCSRRAPKETDILARVNNYEITRAEFEEEFRNSPFYASDTPESRKEFLSSLIDKKLILQYAGKKGIDKDKAFLRMIERFCEQSLLKLALDRKAKEIAGSSVTNDREIREFYEKMVREGRATGTYAEMYGQLNWEITKVREGQLMNNWLAELHKNARINIDQEMLKK